MNYLKQKKVLDFYFKSFDYIELSLYIMQQLHYFTCLFINMINNLHIQNDKKDSRNSLRLFLLQQVIM